MPLKELRFLSRSSFFVRRSSQKTMLLNPNKNPYIKNIVTFFKQTIFFKQKI